jgi:hypothetical protein
MGDHEAITRAAKAGFLPTPARVRNGKPGSAWRPAVAPGSDSPKRPGAAIGMPPLGAHRGSPASSRRRPPSRSTACCRTSAPAAAPPMAALGRRSWPPPSAAGGTLETALVRPGRRQGHLARRRAPERHHSSGRWERNRSSIGEAIPRGSQVYRCGPPRLCCKLNHHGSHLK